MYTEMNAKFGNLAQPAPRIWNSGAAPKQLNLNKLSDAGGSKGGDVRQSQKPNSEFISVYKVWSLIPMLRYQLGHPYAYNLAVGKACQLNGWTHKAAVPTSCLINSLPSHWEKILGEDYFVAADHSIIWKSPWQKLKTLLKTVVPLYKALRKINREEGQKVLFLEQFFLPQLMTLTLAAMLLRPKAELWLLHRYAPHQLPLQGKLHQLCHHLLSRSLNLKLLTDSDLLKKEQERVFKAPIFVLPIPHTEDFAMMQKSNNEELILWWPGGSTTPAKGLLHIKKLAQQEAQGVRLIVAESAKQTLQGAKLPITFIVSDLPREMYAFWMNQADIILLPYDAKTYQEATSGIFVEAIIAGKVPVVNAGTWMAYELSRFHLEELIVDWNQEDLVNYFQTVKSSAHVLEKLEKMRQAYHAFHSIEGFAKELEKVRMSHV